MPSFLSHPAVPLAIGLGLGRAAISPRLLAFGVAASILPDFDVLAFRMGIDYADALGHRGVTHSLMFALAIAIVALLFAPQLRAPPKTAFLFVLVAAASHGLFDMLTNGGLGVAILWPFSDGRYFFPLRVIEASPLSLRRFFGPSGYPVLLSEVLWVWLPCALAYLALRRVRREHAR